jgi:hypothetical protein
MFSDDPAAVAHSLESFGFSPLAEFNGAPFGVRRAPDLDASAWERHLDTDEFLMVPRAVSVSRCSQIRTIISSRRRPDSS